MEIKVTKCGDCIFRDHDWNPDAIGADTHDSCILLRDKYIYTNLNVNYTIAVYNLTDEHGVENHPKELETTLSNCPLTMGKISVKLVE